MVVLQRYFKLQHSTKRMTFEIVFAFKMPQYVMHIPKPGSKSFVLHFLYKTLFTTLNSVLNKGCFKSSSVSRMGGADSLCCIMLEIPSLLRVNSFTLQYFSMNAYYYGIIFLFSLILEMLSKTCPYIFTLCYSVYKVSFLVGVI